MQQSMRGQTFAGYVVQEKIGQGGMSTVYRAQDTQLRRDVALKVFSSALTEGSDQFVARFQSEAQILAGLEHPYIVPLYAHGIENGQPYIVQRLVRGGSLRNVIAGAPSDLDDLARMIGQVAAALDHAHERSVMHLDLKPENILLDDSGNALIADFGLTRLFKTELTESAIVGTPTYLSPEQARGDATGSYTDIYTLGVVLYEAITGEPPFMGDSPMAIIMQHVTETPRPVTEVRRDVPEAVNEVIAKALAKDPEDRYEFAGALARDFEQAIRSAPMQQQVQQQAQEPQIQQMLEGFEEKNIPPPPPPVPTFTYTGKTIDEAIQNGLRDRRRPRDEVDITIIDEPRGGVLGIGGRPAKIELTEKMPPIIDPDELIYTLEFTEPEVIRGQRINIYPGNSIVLAPRRMLPLAEDVGVSGPDGESIETTDYGFDDDNLGRGRITFIRRGDELISLGYFTIQRGQGEITNQNSRALKVMAGDTISDSSRIERGTFSFTIHCNHTATLHVTSPPAPAPQQQQISKRASSINIPDLEPKVRMITLNNLNRVILQRDPDLWKTPAAGDRRIPADTDFAVARRDGAFYAVGRFDVLDETMIYDQNTPLPFGREITIRPHDSDTELVYFAPEQLRDLWAEQDGVVAQEPEPVQQTAEVQEVAGEDVWDGPFVHILRPENPAHQDIPLRPGRTVVLHNHDSITIAENIDNYRFPDDTFDVPVQLSLTRDGDQVMVYSRPRQERADFVDLGDLIQPNSSLRPPLSAFTFQISTPDMAYVQIVAGDTQLRTRYYLPHGGGVEFTTSGRSSHENTQGFESQIPLRVLANDAVHLLHGPASYSYETIPDSPSEPMQQVQVEIPDGESRTLPVGIDIVIESGDGDQVLQVLFYQPGDVAVEIDDRDERQGTIIAQAPGANVRAGASYNFDLIATVDPDEPVIVLDVTQTEDDNEWLNIRLADGTEGWIAADLVSIEDEAQAEDSTPLVPIRQRYVIGEKYIVTGDLASSVMSNLYYVTEISSGDSQVLKVVSMSVGRNPQL